MKSFKIVNISLNDKVISVRDSSFISSNVIYLPKISTMDYRIRYEIEKDKLTVLLFVSECVIVVLERIVYS